MNTLQYDMNGKPFKLETKVTFLGAKGQRQDATPQQSKDWTLALDGSSIFANAESLRGNMAKELANLLPQYVGVGVVAVELENDEVIEVRTLESLTRVLPAIAQACIAIAAIKADNKGENEYYKSAVDTVVKVEKETGKRGRKAADNSSNAVATRNAVTFKFN